jgi:glycerol-3-phosphate dehydrogenase (NAD(P)+)
MSGATSGGLAVAGAGAFGTALAAALAQGRGERVVLWSRDPQAAEGLRSTRRNPRLPGVTLPPGVEPTSDAEALGGADIVLLAVPMQALGGLLAAQAGRLAGRRLVAACKGIDLGSLLGPTALIARHCPGSPAAVLTGPSFAADIARGLPTALTLACAEAELGPYLQRRLATPVLRLYSTTDVTGAELGGALKNVVAIACGACAGGGFGESARAALLTRGFAEMRRLALRLGARAETLAGLSGLGDLVLTATSSQSRNFRAGFALGEGRPLAQGETIEGVATAAAAVALAARLGQEMPVAAAVSALVAGRRTAAEAMRALLDRPQKEE